MNFSTHLPGGFDPATITYLEADHVYVRIHFKDGSSKLHRGSLSNLVQTINDRRFFQVHRSYAINLTHIQQFSGRAALLGENLIPISARRRSAFLERLNLIEAEG